MAALAIVLRAGAQPEVQSCSDGVDGVGFDARLRARRAPSPWRVVSDADGELWAVAEFCPKLFDDSKDDCAIDAITALSVSSLRDMVRRDFLWMLIPLLLVGLFALLFVLWMAGVIEPHGINR